MIILTVMQDLRKRVHKIQNAIMPRGVRARKQHAQIWSAILSSLVLGMLFGSVGSLLVNCALVEISLSPLFATAFMVHTFKDAARRQALRSAPAVSRSAA